MGDSVMLTLRKLRFMFKKIKNLIAAGAGMTMHQEGGKDAEKLRQFLGEFYQAVDLDRQEARATIRKVEDEVGALMKRLHAIPPEEIEAIMEMPGVKNTLAEVGFLKLKDDEVEAMAATSESSSAAPPQDTGPPLPPETSRKHFGAGAFSSSSCGSSSASGSGVSSEAIVRFKHRMDELSKAVKAVPPPRKSIVHDASQSFGFGGRTSSPRGVSPDAPGGQPSIVISAPAQPTRVPLPEMDEWPNPSDILSDVSDDEEDDDDALMAEIDDLLGESRMMRGDFMTRPVPSSLPWRPPDAQHLASTSLNQEEIAEALRRRAPCGRAPSVARNPKDNFWI